MIVLATGAIERAIAYANNDLPGTMLAGAARQYVEAYGVKPGARAVVFTNHDEAYDSAFALHRAGVEIAAIVDARDEGQISAECLAAVRDLRLPLHAASVLRRAHGKLRVHGVDIVPREGSAAAYAGGDARRKAGGALRLRCDTVAVSGGYNPVVHLFSQARGTLDFDARIGELRARGNAVRHRDRRRRERLLRRIRRARRRRRGGHARRQHGRHAAFRAGPPAGRRRADRPRGATRRASLVERRAATSRRQGLRRSAERRDGRGVPLAAHENY